MDPVVSRPSNPVFRILSLSTKATSMPPISISEAVEKPVLTPPVSLSTPTNLESLFPKMNLTPEESPALPKSIPNGAIAPLNDVVMQEEEAPSAPLLRLLQGGIGYGIPDPGSAPIKPYLRPFVKPVAPAYPCEYRQVGVNGGGAQRPGFGIVTRKNIVKPMRGKIGMGVIKMSNGSGGGTNGVLRNGNNGAIMKQKPLGTRRAGGLLSKAELDAEMDKYNAERSRKSLAALDAELDKYQAVTAATARGRKQVQQGQE